MHGARRIEMVLARSGGDDDAPVLRFDARPWTNSRPVIAFCRSALTVP